MNTWYEGQLHTLFLALGELHDHGVPLHMKRKWGGLKKRMRNVPAHECIPCNRRLENHDVCAGDQESFWIGRCLRARGDVVAPLWSKLRRVDKWRWIDVGARELCRQNDTTFIFVNTCDRNITVKIPAWCLDSGELLRQQYCSRATSTNVYSTARLSQLSSVA